MSTVLLATDGSDLAIAAMERGVALLGRDHRFVLLSVVSSGFMPAASTTPMEVHPVLADTDAGLAAEAERRAETTTELDELDDRLAIRSEHRIEPGDPGPTICHVADEVGADVIVVGSHGQGWIQRVLIGSVSTHLLHHAPCPVLVVRADEGR